MKKNLWLILLNVGAVLIAEGAVVPLIANILAYICAPAEMTVGIIGGADVVISMELALLAWIHSFRFILALLGLVLLITGIVLRFLRKRMF
ncbi:MAG: hypothetical protein IJ333_04930 [Clostridia bacterium]|nr:hypothetical protein [Clostridia bacterium]